MMSERWLWDRFLFQIRESGLIPEGGKILDVGTGSNTTILEMFDDKWDVTPSDVNVGDWNSHIPGMIELNVMDIAVHYNQDWDCIMMSEVLEHIPPTDIDGVLGRVHWCLKPGGILVISTPFMYRIHEYGDDDPETVEPSLKDYGRITPSGMEWYLARSAFIERWVGRLVKDDVKTFPAFYCPEGVVAWAKKAGDGEEKLMKLGWAEDGWNPELPTDWREQQTRMAEEYERRIADAREAMEPV